MSKKVGLYSLAPARRKHWEMINRILDGKSIYKALKTHAEMRGDIEPTGDFMALSLAIHMVTPKKYMRKESKPSNTKTQ